MAGEVQFNYQALKTTYFLVRSRTSQVWSTSGGTGAFESYSTVNYESYVISATEQGTASAFYAGTMPAAVPPGVYGITAKAQITGDPLETDPTIAGGDLQWNGTVTLPLSDLATSGQLSQIGPIKLARGVMVQNFPIYLKSSVDHVTPFTSGVVSGQIIKDGGNVFTALQSGAFSEVGNGFYNLQALTSGDLSAGSVKLLFTAAGISGGQSDPLPMGIILQKVSGYA